MSGRYPDWESDGANWPNRDASAFVVDGGYRWHVQDMAGPEEDAPVCVLIHGTGAATHSWRDVMPMLAKNYRVIAVDLPGHGFTKGQGSQRVTLPQMAQSVGSLCDALGVTPAIMVGHSAGAAIALELALQRGLSVPIIGLNPALLPFPGLAAKLFPGLAKALFRNPFVSVIFARMARTPADVERFLRRATGSQLDADGVKFYHCLMRRSGHCDGAIRMMASWQLEPLEARLPKVTSPVLLVHGGNDKAIPRSAVGKAAQLIPACEMQEIAGLGHLSHEEDPEKIVKIIESIAKKAFEAK